MDSPGNMRPAYRWSYRMAATADPATAVNNRPATVRRTMVPLRKRLTRCLPLSIQAPPESISSLISDERGEAPSRFVEGVSFRPPGRRDELLRRLRLRGIPVDHRPVSGLPRRRRAGRWRHHGFRRAPRVRSAAGLGTAERPDPSVLAHHDRRLRPSDGGGPAAGAGRQLAGGGVAHRAGALVGPLVIAGVLAVRLGGY